MASTSLTASMAERNRLQEGRARGDAFTLVELLVVVAIIAILVAMLLPSLQNAKVKANQAACMNNLRQIHVAFANYATDWDDFIPAISTLAVVGQPGGTWCQRLGRAGYLGSAEIHASSFGPSPADRYRVFRCPAETRPTQSLVTMPYWDYPYTRTSYVLNWSVSGYAWGTPRKGFFAGPRFASCSPSYTDANTPHAPKPEDAPFVTDTQDQGDGWAMSYFHDAMDVEPHWMYSASYTGFYHAFRHGGRANLLFMDGHVTSVAPRYRPGGTLNWRLLWNCPPP